MQLLIYLGDLMQEERDAIGYNDDWIHSPENGPVEVYQGNPMYTLVRPILVKARPLFPLLWSMSLENIQAVPLADHRTYSETIVRTTLAFSMLH